MVCVDVYFLLEVYVVFDVGGSAIKYAIMNEHAEILEKGKIPTPQDSLEHFLNLLNELIQLYEKKICGIAVSAPGTIDTKTGQIFSPGALSYNRNVNLVDQLHRFTDLPIAIENDGKCAALAEAWKGNLQDCESGVVIVLGTGLGGGIIYNHELMHGAHLFAGEFSFIQQVFSQPAMKGAWALQGSATALILETAKRKHVEPETLNGYKIFEGIALQDEDCKAALKTVCQSLAQGIFNLQCILDPQKILIGGGISQQPVLMEMLIAELDQLYAGIPFDIPRARVETCRFYNDSNLMGAFYHSLTGEIS